MKQKPTMTDFWLELRQYIGETLIYRGLSIMSKDHPEKLAWQLAALEVSKQIVANGSNKS